LVAATALGTAAAVHHAVAAALAARTRLRVLPRVRDNALIALGQTHAALTAALLAALATTRLADVGHADAHLCAAAGKAHGVDAARRAVNDLAPLIGAAGFQHESVVTKARNDLTALLYADGIHDSLYRSAGKTILAAVDQDAASAAA
jgi:hypothetical protein